MRQQNYRTSTNNRKGHGRETALANVKKLERSWDDFTKTYSETSAVELLKRAVENQIGRIVLLKPRRARFLDTVGKSSRIDSTSWPWYRLVKFFERKCQRIGITFIAPRQRVAAGGAG